MFLCKQVLSQLLSNYSYIEEGQHFWFKQLPTNCHLAGSFQKVLEQLLMIQLLIKYLAVNNFLDSHLFGFRASRSTSYVICEFVHRISQALDKLEGTIGVSCDLSKAFDCVTHTLILKNCPSMWFQRWFLTI